METVNVNELIKILENASLVERKHIISQLPQPMTDLVEALIVILNRESGRLTWLAANALSCIDDVRVVPALVDALPNLTCAVQIMVTEILGDLGDQQAFDILIKMLDSESMLLQMTVIRALTKIADKRSVVPLMTLLEQTELSTVRYTIIEALGDFGDAQAFELIQRYKNDEDDHVRQRAERALKKLTVKR